MKKQVICIAVLVLALAGCGQSKQQESPMAFQTATPRESAVLPSATPTAPPVMEIVVPTPTPGPVIPEGCALNVLTGEYIDEEIAARRPVAVVINNLYAALPQSGVSQAAVYYEVIAEGAITRIIAVFQDFDAAKIGSIRSTRHYFLDFALDNDAIFAHHGQSPQGEIDLAALKIDNLNGMKLDGTYYWRDPVRASQPGMKEHSSYTSAENIWKYIEKVGYRTERAAGFDGMFAFYNGPTVPAGGVAAVQIETPFANAFRPSFQYDAETKLYYRTEYNEAQIDVETGGQLAVTNVVVQNVVVRDLNDAAGRRDVALVSSGTGYLFTNGVVVPLTWEKTSRQSPTQWFDADGNKLKLNVGKTWFCVTAMDPIYE